MAESRLRDARDIDATVAPNDGKTDSVETLFRNEYDAMLRLAFVLLRSQEDAEEVVQDAFLKVQTRWSTLLNPGGYLRTTVVNGARSTLARTSNRRRIVAIRVAPPLRAAVRAENEPDYLLDLLDTLPERHRTAVILAYYLDLGPNDIAEALGCRPGTAKSLVHRGLQRLRKELSNG